MNFGNISMAALDTKVYPLPILRNYYLHYKLNRKNTVPSETGRDSV